MTTIIINGGEALPESDLPRDWDHAKEIQDQLNEKHENGLAWRWDCGFKLDFDGGIINVESRFYPPRAHYGAGWDGTCRVSNSKGGTITEKKFECATFEQLTKEVEDYVAIISRNIDSILSSNF